MQNKNANTITTNDNVVIVSVNFVYLSDAQILTLKR